MRWIGKKKSRKAPLAAGAGLAGGILFALGYRLWNRRKAGGRREAESREEAADAAPRTAEEAGRLAEKFHGLDKENRSGHIPKDLERSPKNLEQSLHPG